jgi:[acyl-carrier-protein] S-malonyltransferase
MRHLGNEGQQSLAQRVDDLPDGRVTVERAGLNGDLAVPALAVVFDFQVQTRASFVTFTSGLNRARQPRVVAPQCELHNGHNTVAATVDHSARMAESADAEASKAFTRKGVWVQVPLRARCYRGAVSDWPVLPFNDHAVALFPGQGSLSAGAGAAWHTSRHWDIVRAVSEVSGVDVEHLLLKANDEEVVRTDNAQLATFALSMVGYGELLDDDVRPRYLLGHSLGEFSALVASGLLSLDEGARLIAVRGAAMARAAAGEEGSMVALMGGDEGARVALDSLDEVWLANVNGTGQLVVSGTRRGLDDLLERHRDLGWRRATLLPVGGAFHSRLMAPAQVELDRALALTTWGDTDAILIANVDGRVHTAALEWRELLSRQLTSPVQFLDATLALPDTVTTTIELPPGGVLTGLTRRIREFDEQFAPASPLALHEIAL